MDQRRLRFHRFVDGLAMRNPLRPIRRVGEAHRGGKPAALRGRWGRTATAAASLMLLPVSACSGDAGSDPRTDDGAWIVEADLRIGQLDGPPEYTFGQIRTVLPGPDDGIWVLDSQFLELRLYDSTGVHVRTVGGSGEGPGEFTGNTCAFPGPGGEIWVEDSGRRWQRFDDSGGLVGSIPVTSNVTCSVRRWTQDGRFFVLSSIRTSPLPAPAQALVVEHRLTAEGNLAPGDTAFLPALPETPTVTWVTGDGRSSMITALPFTHPPFSQLGLNGDLWMAPGGGRYLIERRTVGGDSLQAFVGTVTPVAIPDSIRERAIREFQPEGLTAQGGFDVERVPRSYPPFDRIYEATDGRLWVRRPLEDGRSGFDLFLASGDFMGSAEVPDDLHRMVIHHITDSHMFGVARDELDVPYAVRLAIRDRAD